MQVWKNRKNGEVDYYITQMLTGHGYFREYLHHMGKWRSPFCIYGEKETLDDSEHTFFSCRRWAESRQRLEAEIGVISPTNVVQKMINSKESWNAVKHFVEHILRSKKFDLDAADWE